MLDSPPSQPTARIATSANYAQLRDKHGRINLATWRRIRWLNLIKATEHSGVIEPVGRIPGNHPEQQQRLRTLDQVARSYRNDPRFEQLASDPVNNDSIRPQGILEAMAVIAAERARQVVAPVMRSPTGHPHFLDAVGTPIDVRIPRSPAPGEAWQFDPTDTVKAISTRLRSKAINPRTQKQQPITVLLDTSYLNNAGYRALKAAMEATLTPEERRQVTLTSVPVKHLAGEDYKPPKDPIKEAERLRLRTERERQEAERQAVLRAERAVIRQQRAKRLAEELVPDVVHRLVAELYDADRQDWDKDLVSLARKIDRAYESSERSHVWWNAEPGARPQLILASGPEASAVNMPLVEVNYICREKKYAMIDGEGVDILRYQGLLAKRAFLKELAEQHAPELQQAFALTDGEIEGMKQGFSPEGMSVHHKMPLGGSNNPVVALNANDPENLILIPDNAHRAIHEYLDPQIIDLEPGQSRLVMLPVPEGRWFVPATAPEARKTAENIVAAPNPASAPSPKPRSDGHGAARPDRMPRPR